MLRLFILSLSILYSCFTWAKTHYQVDLIVFSYPQSGDTNHNLALTSPLLPISQKVISLNSNKAPFYSLLPASKSSLRDQYYLLSHKSPYPVLGHYSWIQPNNNQSPVALPKINHKGWQVQGTLRIRQNNYYQFHAHLQLSPPNHPEVFFTVNQNQRLKDNEVYFLDHPLVGMIVKIHQLK